MKRNIHRTVLLLALLGLICTLALSCDSEPLPDDRLIGTWTSYIEEKESSWTYYITFNEDGTGWITIYNGISKNMDSSMDYTRSEGTIDINYTFWGMTGTLNCSYRLDSDSRMYMTITNNNGNTSKSGEFIRISKSDI